MLVMLSFSSWRLASVVLPVVALALGWALTFRGALAPACPGLLRFGLGLVFALILAFAATASLLLLLFLFFAFTAALAALPSLLLLLLFLWLSVISPATALLLFLLLFPALPLVGLTAAAKSSPLPGLIGPGAWYPLPAQRHLFLGSLRFPSWFGSGTALLLVSSLGIIDLSKFLPCKIMPVHPFEECSIVLLKVILVLGIQISLLRLRHAFPILLEFVVGILFDASPGILVHLLLPDFVIWLQGWFRSIFLGFLESLTQ